MDMSGFSQITLAELYNSLLKEGFIEIPFGKYTIIECANTYKTITNNCKEVPIKYISKHKTEKHLIKFTCENGRAVTTTTDHTCMRYNRDYFLENVRSCSLRVGDMIPVIDNGREKISYISTIEDLGTTEDWVYDIEVDDPSHSFYANDILVHNSQFINLACVTDYFRKENNLDYDIKKWDDESKLKFFAYVKDFVDNELNPYINELIGKNCHTSQGNVLKYELEYIASSGIYEAKKRYICHKIVEEGNLVDKFKYTGIELKKATVPVQIKEFLKDIYENTILNNWTEATYHDYLNKCFEKFKTFTVEELAIYKGYNTAKDSLGFLKAQKGASSHVRALQYYNSLIKKLGIASKYSEIILGDKLRFFHVSPQNEYGIDVIAFKDQYPKEFKDIFQIDYETMFTKLILQPLRGYEHALKFSSIDPSNQMEESIMDL